MEAVNYINLLMVKCAWITRRREDYLSAIHIVFNYSFGSVCEIIRHMGTEKDTLVITWLEVLSMYGFKQFFLTNMVSYEEELNSFNGTAFLSAATRWWNNCTDRRFGRTVCFICVSSFSLLLYCSFSAEGSSVIEYFKISCAYTLFTIIAIVRLLILYIEVLVALKA